DDPALLRDLAEVDLLQVHAAVGRLHPLPPAGRSELRAWPRRPARQRRILGNVGCGRGVPIPGPRHPARGRPAVQPDATPYVLLSASVGAHARAPTARLSVDRPGERPARLQRVPAHPEQARLAERPQDPGLLIPFGHAVYAEELVHGPVED